MTRFHIPDHVTQRTGSHCQFSNCAPAIGAWLARAATSDAVKLTPEEFRQKAGGGSGSPNPATGCKTFFERDLTKGLNNLGIGNTLVTVPFSDFRDRIAKERRAVFAVATAYEKWPVELDCMNGTASDTTNHMVGILPGVDDRGRLTISNPLCPGYQKVPMAAVFEAAPTFAREHSRNGILLVRVYRQKPADSVGDKARIADLEDQVAERDDYIASARALFAEGMGLAVPK